MRLVPIINYIHRVVYQSEEETEVEDPLYAKGYAKELRSLFLYFVLGVGRTGCAQKHREDKNEFKVDVNKYNLGI